ncbi:MAG: type II toxin-antitoxin system HicA family toxin [Oxalobacteraceae bacterium]
MTSRELITLLKQNGWILRGSKGSHQIFVHPSKAGHLTVPHPKKDPGTGLRTYLVRPLPALAVPCRTSVLSAVLPPCHRPNEIGSYPKDPEAGWIEMREMP